MVVLIVGFGVVTWLCVLGFFLALCRASGQADAYASARRRGSGDATRATATAPVLDLSAWRAARTARAVAAGRLARAR